MSVDKKQIAKDTVDRKRQRERQPIRLELLDRFRRIVSRNTGLFWILLAYFAPYLLAAPLSGQCLFRAALVTRLEIVGMLLDILDNIFLLNFPLETAKRTLDRFALLDSDLCHRRCHPPRAAPVSDSGRGPNLSC